MEQKKNYGAIDIFKFVCALLVVVLHVATYAFADMASDSAPPTGKDNPFLFTLPAAYAILRIAVPFFFISSAFFLFKKIKENPEDGKKLIKGYCIRLLKLYLFWFVINLPIMIDEHIICGKADLWTNILKFLLRIVLYGGFSGAWYLLASLVAVPLIYWMSTKMKNWQMFTITGVMYALACLNGTYLHLFDNCFLGDVFKFLCDTLPFYHSFFNGAIFVLIGRTFAYKETLIPNKLNIALLAITPFFMYGELVLTNYYGLNYATDCFFSLAIFSVVFFQFVLNLNVTPKPIHKSLRQFSTFIYLFHFIFLYVLYRFASTFNWTIFYSNIPVIIAVYIASVGVSILMCWLTQKLSKKIKILKYAI